MRTYSDVIIAGAGASGLLCAAILAGHYLKKVFFESSEDCYIGEE